jgi:hypothetical protein
MAPQAVDIVRARPSPQTSSQTLPSLGLRGGLGKTLLIAFLILAIVPLSLLALLTYHQLQRDTAQRVMASLEAMVTLKEAHLVDWIRGYERELALVAGQLDTEKPTTALANGSEAADPTRESLNQLLADQLAAVRRADPGLAALILVDPNNREIIAASGEVPAHPESWLPAAGPPHLIVVPPERQDLPPVPALSHRWTGGWLIGVLDWNALWQIVDDSAGAQAVTTSLVTGDGWMASGTTFLSLRASKPEDLPESTRQAWSGQNGKVFRCLAPISGIRSFKSP